MRDRLALHTTAASIAALVLAPLARPGYVLSYDMNFVPRQPLRLDLIAPVGPAPRAVPLDAAVSLLNLAMPGWLLQRLALVAIIWAAVVGAGRLVPTDRLAVRLIAAVGYGWTPFLAERLLLGQWGLLIAYAAMPWLVIAALRLTATAPPLPTPRHPPPTQPRPLPTKTGPGRPLDTPANAPPPQTAAERGGLCVVTNLANAPSPPAGAERGRCVVTMLANAPSPPAGAERGGRCVVVWPA